MKYCKSRDAVEISVKELCSAAYMHGDIDNRPHSGFAERASDMERAQRKLYEVGGVLYHLNVPLVNTCRLDDIYFTVSGYATGVLPHSDGYYVDGIISINKERFLSRGIEELRRAELYCYAYFLCCAKNLERIEIREFSYDTERDEIEYECSGFDIRLLRDKYIGMLSKILWRAKILVNRAKERIPSAANAIFPYKSLRESQSEMIKECYRDIKHGSRLFCQAPTGIGKTVSTLFPSVKCVGEGVADKIFYLTSKQSIRREAFSAMERLNGAGVALRTCSISSRESMCKNFQAKSRGGRLSSNCNPLLCPYAQGYYDKVSLALAEIIASGDVYDGDIISAVAERYRICPYELSLDLSELCDVIVCDYNYVFSPTVYLKRYFDADREEKYIFLVDEAHNLPDRAREIFSSRISRSDFNSLIAALDSDSALRSACVSVVEAFDRLGKLCDDDTHYDSDGSRAGYSVSRQLPDNFSDVLSSFLKKSEAWMKNNPDHPASFTVEDLGFKIFEYGKIAERYDKGYITFIEKRNDNISLLLYCLDPAGELSRALDRACASILFSATLTPTDYFADILGGGKKTVSVSFRTPFPSENLCVAVVDGISTRFEDREASYKKISSCIAATASSKSGNYMVFFPSYGYMTEVKSIFQKKYPNVRVLEQTKGMSPSQKEEFISAFKDDGKTRIAFCVLGGSFSEGIDLPGDRLIGVICVGVGLPGLSNENNIIRDYYEEKNNCGYDYAYTYPGMNSILQAVGRVIRTETDRGIAVLIDDRYAELKYRQLFPAEWKDVKFAGNAKSLAEIARIFWKK